MDFTLSDEQRAIIGVVRDFVRNEIVPLEADLDPDESSLPPEDHLKLQQRTTQMGLFNIDMPEEAGGPGIDTVTRSLLAIEMSQHRAGLYAPCYDSFGPPGIAVAPLADGTEDQKARYLYPAARGEKSGCFALSEPSGGSDPARAIRTRAIKHGSEWVINGSKLWISSADVADYALVFARTGAPDSGRSGVTCFIVDTDSEGFHVRRMVHTLRAGHCATELQFEDLRVSEANVLGKVGGGFDIANTRLSKARIPYSAQCLGVAVKAQELAIEYAKVREVFGKKLSQHQGIEWMLVDNEYDIRSATLLVLHAADRADKGRPFRTEAAVAKIAATEAAARVVDRAMQIHGGMGMTKEMPLERWYRELRIRRVGEGPTEVQRMVIGRDLLNDPYRFFLT
jgi:acyl-CoA dehydrogenase